MGLLIDPMEDTFFRRLYEKGLREGEEKGREQGEAAILLRMLRRKFGTIPAASEDRINSAAPDQLERWSDRLFTATDVDDVLA